MKKEKKHVTIIKNLKIGNDFAVLFNKETIEKMYSDDPEYFVASNSVEVEFELADEPDMTEKKIKLIDDEINKLNGQVYALEQQRKELLALESK